MWRRISSVTRAPSQSSNRSVAMSRLRSGLKLEEALAKIETDIPTPETLQLVAFIRRSERGICRE